MTQPPATLNAVLSHVTQFLIVAIHAILFERSVYPLASFITARAYDLPVKQNRHPGVCSWIQSAAAAVREQLAKGTVARVAVAIAHPESCDVLERFMFDVRGLPVLPKADWDVPIERIDTLEEEQEASRSSGNAEGSELIDLTEQFRGVLSALSTCGSRLKPIPTGCLYTVAIELKEDSDAPLGHPQPWIPTQPSLQRIRGSGKTLSQEKVGPDGDDASADLRRGHALGGQHILPIRAVDAGELTMEIWVEEGRAKDSLTALPFQGNTESIAQEKQ